MGHAVVSAILHMATNTGKAKFLGSLSSSAAQTLVKRIRFLI